MNKIKKLERSINSHEYILFDLDNTIYDQNMYDYRQYQQFFALYFDFTQSQKLATNLVEFKNQKPYGYQALFDDFFKENQIDLDISSMVNFYKNPKKNILENINSLYPLLQKLYQQKRLYLITNGYLKTQNIKIDSLKIRNFFQKIYILEPQGDIALKPSCDVLHYLDIELSKSVYIGDNIQIDKEFAKNCQIDFIHFQFNG